MLNSELFLMKAQRSFLAEFQYLTMRAHWNPKILFFKDSYGSLEDSPYKHASNSFWQKSNELSLQGYWAICLATIFIS